MLSVIPDQTETFKYTFLAFATIAFAPVLMHLLVSVVPWHITFPAHVAAAGSVWEVLREATVIGFEKGII